MGWTLKYILFFQYYQAVTLPKCTKVAIYVKYISKVAIYVQFQGQHLTLLILVLAIKAEKKNFIFCMVLPATRQPGIRTKKIKIQLVDLLLEVLY